MSRALTSVERAANRAAQALEARDQAIRNAWESGETVRAIATAAGLSPSRIHQVATGSK